MNVFTRVVTAEDISVRSKILVTRKICVSSGLRKCRSVGACPLRRPLIRGGGIMVKRKA